MIAEWVENREVLKILIEMGVQYGQGYLSSGTPDAAFWRLAAIPVGVERGSQ